MRAEDRGQRADSEGRDRGLRQRVRGRGQKARVEGRGQRGESKGRGQWADMARAEWVRERELASTLPASP